MSTPLVLAGGAGSGLWQLQCVCVGGGHLQHRRESQERIINHSTHQSCSLLLVLEVCTTIKPLLNTD